jgi:hypothetical protein
MTELCSTKKVRRRKSYSHAHQAKQAADTGNPPSGKEQMPPPSIFLPDVAHELLLQGQSNSSEGGEAEAVSGCKAPPQNRQDALLSDVTKTSPEHSSKNMNMAVAVKTSQNQEVETLKPEPESSQGCLDAPKAASPAAATPTTAAPQTASKCQYFSEEDVAEEEPPVHASVLSMHGVLR